MAPATACSSLLRSRPRPIVAGAVLVALTLAGCSSAKAPASAGTKSPAKTLNIVAGENFWGSIVAQLAGKAGNVTSVVSDPNADPHSYESSSDDARAFATADYVLIDGAGYDAWAQKLLSGNPNSKRRVTVVADLLGKKEGDNPHFWYSPTFVTTVVDRITADLKGLDPGASAYFDGLRLSFDAASKPLHDRLAAIKAKFAGVPVGATETIFAYLADYLGLKLVSPPEFMRAVAEGNDPPAQTVIQFEDQVSSKQIKVLVYNLQTSTAVTTNIKKLAAQQDIPTVGVTETIQPPDATFEQWQTAQLQVLQNALNADVLSGSSATSTSRP
jgi:zinc/manganese transport system substrate-binding protein